MMLWHDAVAFVTCYRKVIDFVAVTDSVLHKDAAQEENFKSSYSHILLPTLFSTYIHPSTLKIHCVSSPGLKLQSIFSLFHQKIVIESTRANGMSHIVCPYEGERS